MKHTYVKNFAHLINIINKVIQDNKDYFEEHRELIGDDKFYYDYVYTQKYCDRFVWTIRNLEPELILSNILMIHYTRYIPTGIFKGFDYNENRVKLTNKYKDK